MSQSVSQSLTHSLGPAVVELAEALVVVVVLSRMVEVSWLESQRFGAKAPEGLLRAASLTPPLLLVLPLLEEWGHLKIFVLARHDVCVLDGTVVVRHERVVFARVVALVVSSSAPAAAPFLREAVIVLMGVLVLQRELRAAKTAILGVGHREGVGPCGHAERHVAPGLEHVLHGRRVQESRINSPLFLLLGLGGLLVVAGVGRVVVFFILREIDPTEGRDSAGVVLRKFFEKRRA